MTHRNQHLDRARRAATCVALVACAGALSGCYIDTQRYPGILKPLENPLPEGAKRTFLRGPEEAYIIRHADPVSVRTAETNSVARLKYYDKRTRASAGSWIYSGPNGHAEVLLPGSTNITMRDNTVGVIGSETRREPLFTFIEVQKASVTFGELQLVELPGGALLESESGPFVIERIDGDMLRVRNRSSEVGVVAYRDQRITLEPSEVVDLAMLGDVGTAPYEIDPASRDVLTEGGRIELRGEVDVVGSSQGTRLRAAGESEITGSGLILRLDPGDEVLFEGLGNASSRRSNGTSTGSAPTVPPASPAAPPAGGPDASGDGA